MTPMHFGVLQFDRASIPPELADLKTWPSVDDRALKGDQGSVYLKRAEAVQLFVGEPAVSLKEITDRTGIDRKSVVRLFKRCVERHADGRIAGFRALVPYNRQKSYARTATVTAHAASSNSTGAFAQLLELYPPLKDWLDRAVRNRRRKSNGQREVRQDLRRIHKNFLAKCRELGLTAAQYPFNRERLGIRSLAAHLKRRTNASFEAAAADAGACHVGRAWPTDVEQSKKPITRPFEAVEFDGHKIDVRLTLKVVDPFGFELLYELGRIWILVIIDVATRAALGYALALGKEYTTEDVIEAIQNALSPHHPRKLTIPGLSYRPEGGMPSAAIPETAYACWNWFRCDNAKTHLAEHTLVRLTEVVGCWPDFGPPGEPNERAFIERFFSLLAGHFAHRLTGTTGSHPTDIHRALGDPNGNTSLMVRVDELEELVDVLMCDYNGDTHDGLGGRTPLEAMRFFLDRRNEDLRTLARTHRDGVLLRDSRTVTIRGQPKFGVRPYINFTGARYSSDVLSRNAALIGKPLRLYFDIKDLRRVRAYFENGEELGYLMASRPWCFTPHSLRTRKEILKLRAQGKLRYRDGDDAVEAYYKYKHAEASHSKQAVRDLAKRGRGRKTGDSMAATTHMARKRTDSPGVTSHVGAASNPDMAQRTHLEAGLVSEQPAVVSTTVEHIEPRVKPLRLRKAIIF
jgi:putative transposase